MTEVNNMEYLVEKQHKQGKLHAIERINRLVDNGSFHEIGQAVINYREDMFGHTLPYDGVILLNIRSMENYIKRVIMEF